MKTHAIDDQREISNVSRMFPVASGGAHSLGSGEPDTHRELFASLDGREVRSRDRAFRIVVYAVHEAGPRRWVQVDLKGRTSRSLVLEMAPGATAGDAVAALTRWLNRAPYPWGGSIVDVA